MQRRNFIPMGNGGRSFWNMHGGWNEGRSGGVETRLTPNLSCERQMVGMAGTLAPVSIKSGGSPPPPPAPVGPKWLLRGEGLMNLCHLSVKNRVASFLPVGSSFQTFVEVDKSGFQTICPKDCSQKLWNWNAEEKLCCDMFWGLVDVRLWWRREGSLQAWTVSKKTQARKSTNLYLG